MVDEKTLEAFMVNYIKGAKKSKRENRMIFNHLCIRTDDIDAAEKLMEESFGITGFLRPGGDLFDGEKELSVAWLNDEVYLEFSQPQKPQELGFDTGCGQPIGHLSEIGFFVPDMDKALEHLGPLGWKVTNAIEAHGARMCKIDQEPAFGVPVELIDIDLDELD